MKTNTIIQGDALTKLKELPEKSINCVMTSPPYWALRDYGSTVETIWDGEENCEHEWDVIKHAAKGGKTKPDNMPKVGSNKKEQEGEISVRFGYETNKCLKCGAWKGQLGLEPTFDLYIKHLCDIFDEVKRALRDDGTCWINLGDTYYGNGAGTQKNNVEPKGKQVYVMPYGSNRTREWQRPSREEYAKGIIKKNCLFCEKEFKGKENSQFCSRECLNKMGNDFRSQNRLLPDKCLTMIPQRFAIEMVNRGWILRNVIIWHKPNCMPSSVKDRFTVDFEYLFFFVKKKKYWFETQYEPYLTQENRPGGIVREREFGYDTLYPQIRRKTKIPKEMAEQMGSPRARYHRMPPIGGKKQTEGNFNPTYSGNMPNWKQGRNKRAVWQICPKPFSEAHFAVYPEELCETPIKSGCPEGGIVLDPFFGAGTTGLVALKQNKKFIGIELNPEYIQIAKKRLKPYLEQRKLK